MLELARDGLGRPISVPVLVMPELPEVNTDNVVSLPTRRAISTPMWFAIAASVVLAVIVGVQVDHHPVMHMAQSHAHDR